MLIHGGHSTIPQRRRKRRRFRSSDDSSNHLHTGHSPGKPRRPAIEPQSSACVWTLIWTPSFLVTYSSCPCKRSAIPQGHASCAWPFLCTRVFKNDTSNSSHIIAKGSTGRLAHIHLVIRLQTTKLFHLFNKRKQFASCQGPRGSFICAARLCDLWWSARNSRNGHHNCHYRELQASLISSRLGHLCGIKQYRGRNGISERSTLQGAVSHDRVVNGLWIQVSRLIWVSTRTSMPKGIVDNLIIARIDTTLNLACTSLSRVLTRPPRTWNIAVKMHD